MVAKVRLAGRKLCKNALKVCSRTEAVLGNTVNDGLCGFQQVHHVNGNFQADVKTKFMAVKVRLGRNKLYESALEL